MTHAIHVYELRCPGCTHSLNGVSSDRLFICAECQEVYCATDGHLKREPLYIANPVHSFTNPLLFLPFWRFKVDICIFDKQHNNVTRQFRAGRLNHVWVAAFFEARPSFFGNPGLNLTASGVSVTPMLWPADTALMLSGAARREEDARLYSQPFVAGIVDREKDISGYCIEVNSHDCEFWAVPFELNRRDLLLRELLTDTVYQTAVVTYFNEIIEANQLAE